MNKCEHCPYEQMIVDCHRNVSLIPTIKEELVALRNDYWRFKLKLIAWAAATSGSTVGIMKILF